MKKKSYPKLCIVCMEFVYRDFIFVMHICFDILIEVFFTLWGRKCGFNYRGTFFFRYNWHNIVFALGI